MEMIRKPDIGDQGKLQREQAEKQQQEQKKENEEDKHYFHVLAVDDSVIDRKVLERLLKVSSYQVTFVDSVDKALEYLGLLDDMDNNVAAASASSSSQQEGMKVNLIMTDYCMPGMSGYDLLKRVKGSSWKDVPVVIMSSENIPSRITRCLEGGAEEFLLKPLQLSDVEKLQPHLLKSLDHTWKKIDNSTNINNKSASNHNVIKRKALSPDTADRRPKMKEMAVV